MIRNESMETLRFEVGLELGCDFADIFAVKEHDFTLGDPEHAKPLPPPAPADWDDRRLGLLRRRRRPDAGALLAARPRERLAASRGRSSSASREQWELVVEVLLDGARARPQRPARRSARSWRTCATRSPRGTCTCRR